jgi:hypothetical protein
VTGSSPGSHTNQYRALRDGLVGQSVPLPGDSDSVFVEWGWDTPDALQTATLAPAQAELSAVMDASPAPEGFGLTQLIMTPIANNIRDLMTTGWADVIWYVSDEGKKRTRAAMWNRIVQTIKPDTVTDLVIFAHSAGTLIAHDLLFWLYSGQRDTELQAGAGASGGLSLADVLAARENWRISHFVTFGSPIAPLTVRAPALADAIAGGPPPWMDAVDLGLTEATHAGPDPLWLNVWDRHDIVSYPLRDLYANNARIFDVYPDISDDIRNAHGVYWASKKVHKALAELWND